MIEFAMPESIEHTSAHHHLAQKKRVRSYKLAVCLSCMIESQIRYIQCSHRDYVYHCILTVSLGITAGVLVTTAEAVAFEQTGMC